MFDRAQGSISTACPTSLLFWLSCFLRKYALYLVSVICWQESDWTSWWMRHLNTKYWTDEGVGAKYQKDSEKVKIPSKEIGLLIFWVPIKVPCLVLFYCQMLWQHSVPACPIWNSCLVLLLAGCDSRNKEQTHDWPRRGGITWAIQSIGFSYL